MLTPINLNAYKENLLPFATINFFQDVKYHYKNISEKLNLQALYTRPIQVDALFLINDFSGTKYCPSVLESYVTLPRSATPSDRFVAPANVAYNCTDIFSNSYLNVKSLT
jgi:hypothetical protein